MNVAYSSFSMTMTVIVCDYLIVWDSDVRYILTKPFNLPS